jgi:hypothetical protein
MQTAGVPGETEAGTHFGWSLTTGDLDGDGFDDLAMGATGDAVEFRPPHTMVSAPGP